MVDGCTDKPQPLRHVGRVACIRKADSYEIRRSSLFSVPCPWDRRGGAVFSCHRHWPTNLARASGGSRAILPDTSNPDNRPRRSLHHIRRARRNSVLRSTSSHSVCCALVPRSELNTHSGNIIRSRTHPLPIRSLNRNRGSGSLLRQCIPKRGDVLGLRAGTPSLNGYDQHRVLPCANDSPVSSSPCSHDS